MHIVSTENTKAEKSAAHEHVMAPDDESQSADRQDCVDHGLVAKNRLAGKRREDVRRNAHAGQNRDIHLGMPEKPEQMLPQDREPPL
jgi:hypothetical protein